MFQTKALDRIKTQDLYKITFSDNRAVYWICEKNTVETDRS